MHIGEELCRVEVLAQDRRASAPVWREIKAEVARTYLEILCRSEEKTVIRHIVHCTKHLSMLIQRSISTCTYNCSCVDTRKTRVDACGDTLDLI